VLQIAGDAARAAAHIQHPVRGVHRGQAQQSAWGRAAIPAGEVAVDTDAAGFRRLQVCRAHTMSTATSARPQVKRWVGQVVAQASRV